MALVLTQKASDGPIHFIDKDTGEHIEIQLIQVDYGKARYAITASDNIEILRDVLYQRQQEQNDES